MEAWRNTHLLPPRSSLCTTMCPPRFAFIAHFPSGGCTAGAYEAPAQHLCCPLPHTGDIATSTTGILGVLGQVCPMSVVPRYATRSNLDSEYLLEM